MHGTINIKYIENFLILNQLDPLISQIYFGNNLYMFRTVPLSIIRCFSLYTQQWYILYSFCDSLQQDQDGTETCRVSFQNKFEKSVHQVGSIIRNLSRCMVT